MSHATAHTAHRVTSMQRPSSQRASKALCATVLRMLQTTARHWGVQREAVLGTAKQEFGYRNPIVAC